MAAEISGTYGIKDGPIRICYPFVNLPDRSAAPRLATVFPSGKTHVVYSGAIGDKRIRLA